MKDNNNIIPLESKRIERYIEKLEHFNKLMEKLKVWIKDFDENKFIKSDLKEQFGIYHAFQIIIEIITDIIAMVTKDIKIKPKDDYTNIDCLLEQKVISEQLSINLRKVNGLRNILVHDYNGLDNLLAYRGIKENINSLKEFHEVVSKWLKKNS